MIYKGLRVVVTVGLEPTVTIRNRLPAALTLTGNLCSLELRSPSSRTAGGELRSPIDVSHLGAEDSVPIIKHITKIHPLGVDFCYVVTVGLEPTTPSM